MRMGGAAAAQELAVVITAVSRIERDEDFVRSVEAFRTRLGAANAFRAQGGDDVLHGFANGGSDGFVAAFFEVGDVQRFDIDLGWIGGHDGDDVGIFGVEAADHGEGEREVLDGASHGADVCLAADDAARRDDMTGARNATKCRLEPSDSGEMRGDTNTAGGVTAEVERG